MQLTDTATDRLQTALGDRYRIERELGRGGMATVYLVQDLKHDRPLALKVLRPELAAALGPDRFLREIRTTARLQHPHILTVLDSGEAAGMLWYTMPYVEGESLRDRLQGEGQLPVADALRITREVAEALDYAHRRGVVHRDIKPENILVEDGQAVVADFGVAGALQQGTEAKLTETGLAVGTPAYMSPEQASGGKVDARSDIYALGCVLYEMLAGEPPFTGPTAAAIVAKRCSGPAGSIRVLRPSVPPALDLLLAKSLALTPADRFASAAELGRALAGVEPMVVSSSSDRTTPIASALGPRTHRIALAVVVATAAILITAAALWLRDRSASETMPDAAALAVLPFRTVGPTLDLWREGMVDLLAINLDGAAGLRAVAPRTVLSQWHRTIGSQDPDQLQVLEVARAVGARHALTGSVVGQGRNLRLTADLLDAITGAVEGRAQVEGPADSIPALVDRLSIALLSARSAGRGSEVPAPELSATTTHSLPALKNLLAGEQLFRRGRPQEAIVEYRRAVEHDSSFALGWFRLVIADGWGRPRPHSLRAPEELLQHLIASASRLPKREGRIAALLPGLTKGDASLLAPLRRVAEDYPSDAESWFLLGDGLFHLGGGALEPRDAFRVALRRATQLDPNFAPAYLHLAEDAFDRQDSAEVAGITAVLRRIDSNSVRTVGLMMAESLVWGDAAARLRVHAALDSANAFALMVAKHAMNLTPDLGDSALVFALALADAPRHSPDDRVQGSVGAYHVYRSLGRLREGEARLRKGLRLVAPNIYAELRIARLELVDALIGVRDTVAGDRAYRTLAGQPDTVTFGPAPVLNPITLGWYAVGRGWVGEVDRWVRLAAQRGSEARREGDSLGARRDEVRRRVLQAFLSEARGNAGAVMKELPGALDTLSPDADESIALRFETVRRYVAAGNLGTAEHYLEAFHTPDFSLVRMPGLVELYRGRVAELAGRREDAKDHYTRLLRWWRNADPELQPFVAEAREALGRLTAEARR